ncbi:hypothetical protein LZ31DRAFT_554403 [Colletotrichum somersetense]|nr:hypothetical protein LZ31DRAFT_554403 [Colletotrichum somersetense]
MNGRLLVCCVSLTYSGCGLLCYILCEAKNSRRPPTPSVRIGYIQLPVIPRPLPMDVPLFPASGGATGVLSTTPKNTRADSGTSRPCSWLLGALRPHTTNPLGHPKYPAPSTGPFARLRVVTTQLLWPCDAHSPRVHRQVRDT